MTNQNETTPMDPRLQSRPETTPSELTPEQLHAETSRQNGAKSNGPTTPQGKANSSRNATKHGFLARTIVLPNESPKRFARLLKSLRTQLQPANEVEKDIVDCMAVARWRRLRARGLERAIIGYESKNRAPEFTDLAPTEHSAQTARTLRHFSDDSRFLDNLSRHEARYDRQYDLALKRLLTLRARPQSPAESSL